MALEVKKLKRVFKFKKDGKFVELPDPNKDFSAEEVREGPFLGRGERMGVFRGYLGLGRIRALQVSRAQFARTSTRTEAAAPCTSLLCI